MIALDRNGVQIERGDRVKRLANPGTGVVTGFIPKSSYVIVRWPTGRSSGLSPKVLIVIQKGEQRAPAASNTH